MGYWPIVRKVVHDSDIVLELMDARMPVLSRNRELERMLRMVGKETVKVFTKKDLVSKDYLMDLKRRYPDAYFVSGIKNQGVSKMKTGVLIMAKRLGIKEPLIGIIGYPNVGKSALINALCKSSKAKVSRIAGTTKNIQWLKAGSLRILDSPGVVPFEDDELKLGVLGAKNPEKLRNPEGVALEIINKFMNFNAKTFCDFYNVDIEKAKTLGDYDILLEVGKGRKLLLKGGIVDENRTIMMILRDWQSGKLHL